MNKKIIIGILIAIVILIMAVFTVFEIELTGAWKAVGFTISGGIILFLIWYGFIRKE